MLLRTLALLLPCVSLALSATLGHYQSEEKEFEVPAVDSQETAGDVPTASDNTEKEDDSETTEGAGKQPQLPAELLKADDREDDSHEVETTDIVDESPVNETVEDTDKPAGDMELTGKDLIQQEPPLGPIQTNQSLRNSLTYDYNDRWSLNLIRNSFQTAHGYFDSLVELVGGYNGVCQYRCKYGDLPQPRPRYQLPEPNGCSSSLVGLQLNLGIPAMTNCCNLLDTCYDTCGNNKYDCDTQFRSCLHDICSDIKKSLGFGSKLQSCEAVADTLYNTVWTLGCRPYMNGQRAACVCKGEERDEL